MADNGAPTYANNNAIVEAVGRGEIPMGLVNHYYNERFLAEDPGLPSRNHVFPGGDLGSHRCSSRRPACWPRSDRGRGRRSGSSSFLLAREAQRYYTRGDLRVPARRGRRARRGPRRRSRRDVALAYDIDRLGGELEGTARLIERERPGE